MASNSASSRAFPGFERIFMLRGPDSDAFRVQVKGEINPWALTRGEARVDEPLVLRWTMGADAPLEVVGATRAVVMFVHERVIETLRSNAFTGWRTYPVRMFGKEGAEIGGYHGLAITGRSGPIDEARARTVMKRFPARARAIRVGLYFDPATWDGSHLFIPGDGNARVFVVEDVKRALEGGVRGFRYEPLPECVLS